MSDPPFGIPPDTILDLPLPPSVNKTRKSYGLGVRAKKEWEVKADTHILLAGGMRKFPKLADRFEATIILDETTCKLDADNPIKNLMDYAKRLGLIKDDSPKYMRRLTVEWGEAPAGCRLILRPTA